MSTVPVPVVWTVPVTWSLASLYHVNFILGFLSVCAEGGGGGGGDFPRLKLGIESSLFKVGIKAPRPHLFSLQLVPVLDPDVCWGGGPGGGGGDQRT